MHRCRLQLGNMEAILSYMYYVNAMDIATENINKLFA